MENKINESLLYQLLCQHQIHFVIPFTVRLLYIEDVLTLWLHTNTSGVQVLYISAGSHSQQVNCDSLVSGR